MMIEWTIRLGDALTIFAFLVGGLSAYWLLLLDVKSMQRDVSELKTTVKTFGEILAKLALQDQRMNFLEKTLDDVRHGHGFIGVKLERRD